MDESSSALASLQYSRDTSSAGGKNSTKQDDVFRLQAMRDVEAGNMMKLPNVKGVAIGNKEVCGQETGQLSLIVFVSAKKPLNQLAEEARVPKRIDTYNSGCPFPTDVVEWPDSDHTDSDSPEE